MKKRWLAGILSALMAMGMTGCGGGAADNNATGGNESGKAIELKMSYTTSETSV